jgi:hypothetical protein
MNAWTALVAALITLPATQALAASVLIQCPERISVEEIPQAIYPSWEVTADKGKVDVRLQSMLLYEGHPREMASLMPDTTTQARGLLVATWRLAKAEADRGYWVGCAYRNSMTLLTRRLPDTVSRCRYTQKILRSGTLAGVESFICE